MSCRCDSCSGLLSDYGKVRIESLSHGGIAYIHACSNIGNIRSYVCVILSLAVLFVRSFLRTYMMCARLRVESIGWATHLHMIDFPKSASDCLFVIQSCVVFLL